MADVTGPLGIGEQIRLVAALRWRIVRNTLRRQDAKWDLIGMIFAGLFAAAIVIGISFAFGAVAYTFLSNGRAGWMALLFWAIFLFWQVFPIIVSGFGQRFEFRSLLRFPLSLSAFFVIGIAYGLADFAALAALCWLLAMTIGATAARPDLLPAMLIIIAPFVGTNVFLERLIGSWLERLLARRRARELVVGLFVLLSLGVQFMVTSLERWGETAVPWAKKLLPLTSAFPPGLAGRAVALAEAHSIGMVLLCAAGIGAYAILIGALLWMRFAAQYRGEKLSETAAPSQPLPVKTAAKRAEEAPRWQWISPQVDAVVRKEFHYLTRNGFVFLSLLIPPFLIFLFSSLFGPMDSLHPRGAPIPSTREFFFPGMMAYLVLILTAPAFNSFAYEARGMQTLFTAPVRFRDVFVGKNLMLLAVIVLEMLLSIAALAFRLGLPSPPLFIATMAAMAFSVIGQLVIANWSSLNYPRKLEFGSLRNQRASGMAVLLAFGTQIVLAGASSVVFLAGRWFGNPWLPAGIFAGLAAGALGGYVASLEALSSLAEKKREVLLDALCK